MWEGIRGGSAHACFAGANGGQQVEITVYGMLEEPLPLNWTYHVAFLPLDSGRVRKERLEVGEHTRIFSWDSNLGLAHLEAEQGRLPLLGIRAFGNSDDDSEIQQRLQSLPDDIRSELLSDARATNALAKLFSNLQRINPVPNVLRTYSQSNQAKRMGDDGQDFAALIRTICQDVQTKDAYLSWLQQLRPEEVDDVGILPGALGEPMFVLVENGRKVLAPVLSDGTLRFAALTASFFQPSMPNLMMIEEIENGIHASRLHLVLELMRSQAENRKTQVVATTHSATVLDWLQQDDYKTAFLCRRDESTGESKICSLADVPCFLESAKNTPVSDLFAEGWMEVAP